MAGRTWKDLKPKRALATDNKVASKETSPDAIALTAEQSPRLSQLLEQRKELEARLRGLTTSGTQDNQRQAARFHVPTFTERQVEQREWEQRHQATQARAAQRRRQQTPETKAAEDGGGTGASGRDEQILPLRQGATESVDQWLNRRDQQRRTLMDSARDRLAKGTALVDKYTEMVEAPKRAVDKIDQFWKTRQNEIGGAMDRAGPYVNSSRQRLSTEKGGSGDLFERMERNRMQALQRRKDQRREEERDEARRQRAKRLQRNGD